MLYRQQQCKQYRQPVFYRQPKETLPRERFCLIPLNILTDHTGHFQRSSNGHLEQYAGSFFATSALQKANSGSCTYLPARGREYAISEKDAKAMTSVFVYTRGCFQRFATEGQKTVQQG